MSSLLRRGCATVVVLALSTLLGEGRALIADEPVRTWTDASGKYSIEATLTGHEGDVVRLIAEGGEAIEMSLAELSEADRAYIAKYDAGNPFLRGMKAADSDAGATSESAETAQERSDASPTPAGSSSGAAETLDARPGAIDWAQVEPIAPPLTGESLSLEIKALPPAAEIAARAIALPATDDIFERVGKLAIDPATGTAILSSVVGRPGGDSRTRLIRIDLTAGRASPPIETAGEYVALAWDGRTNRLIAAESRRGARRSSTLEVWTVENDAVARSTLYAPVGDDPFGHQATTWAAFVANDRIASLFQDGRFAIWSLETNRPVATTTAGRQSGAAASPDGTIVALASSGDVTFIDVAKATSVTRVELNDRSLQNVAFSPDGQSLAMHSLGKLRVLGLNDGAVIDVPHPSPFREPFFFVDSQRLFGGGLLLDVPTGRPILALASPPPAGGAYGDRCWLYAEDRSRKQRTLISIDALPENVAQRLDEPEAKPTIVPLLAEGQALRIDVTGVESKKRRPSVEKLLADAIEKAGHAVDEEAGIVLRASTKQGDAKAYEYTLSASASPFPSGIPIPRSRFGSPFDRIIERRQLTIAPAILTLELIGADEKTIWSKSISQLPAGLNGMARFGFGTSVGVPEGKTVDDFVKEIETVDYERFAKFEIPPTILPVPPPPEPILGRRRLTTTGLE